MLQDAFDSLLHKLNAHGLAFTVAKFWISRLPKGFAAGILRFPLLSRPELLRADQMDGTRAGA